MKLALRRCVLMAWVNACVACGSDAEAPSVTRSEANELVGTWRWSGAITGPAALELSFKPDGRFTFTEQRQPGSLPAGSSPASKPPGFDPESCVPTQLGNGTYVETVSNDVNVLTWTLIDGTAHRVSGCADASLDSPGTPMTAETISSYIEQGMLPPASVRFSVSSSELLLTSSDTTHVGVARGQGTTFTKAR